MSIQNAEESKKQLGGWSAINWFLVLEILFSLTLVASACILVAVALEKVAVPNWVHPASLTVAAIAAFSPALMHWRRAVREGRTAWSPWREPKHEHVSGLGVVGLALVVAAVIWLVLWAAESPDHNREIRQSWGFWVVVGLASAFFLAAVAPAIPKFLKYILLLDFFEALGRRINAFLLKPIGAVLSYLDGVMVFAVAGGAGAGRAGFAIRYWILLAVIGSCAALGYFLQPPLGFIPLFWAFLVSIAVARRWIWIEEDRERAMMDPRFSHAQARVGFSQNLRDEALISFMFMFLLVPIVLRQAQLLANEANIALFATNDGQSGSLQDWIGFYGTELAKAIPFVDWAEIYDVSGNANIEPSSALSLHIVFATRVLIDLVFLAAFLQALSIASRDASQRELFYIKKTRDYLDPFSEPNAIRALVRKASDGGWERSVEFESFPKYNENRLFELSASHEEQIRVAAQMLIERDKVTSNPHFALSQEAARRPIKKEAITDQIEAIRSAGKDRNVYQLDLARRRLVRYTSASVERMAIVELLLEAERSAEQVQAIRSVVMGDAIEPRKEVREIALTRLIELMKTNDVARGAVEHVAQNDAAVRLREMAKKAIRDNPEEA